MGPYGLLEIDALVEDAERRATERLSKINVTLLGRTPGEGFISIREMLFQIVLQACEITGARYGALGVLNPDGVSLRDFIYVGVPEDTAKAIGHLSGSTASSAISQVDSQRIHLDLETVHLPQLASSIVSQVVGALGTHTVVVVVTGEPPAVLADPLRLEQVVTNLLENAAKYSDEGTPIRILIEPTGRGAALSVEDHGPGIAPEELPLLFDRFFQTQRARAKRRGLGLGLFITKGLVEAHGGTISVESVPGAGSTFRIWLPAKS